MDTDSKLAVYEFEIVGDALKKVKGIIREPELVSEVKEGISEKVILNLKFE